MGRLPHPMSPFSHPIEANGFSPRLGRPLNGDGVRGADGVFGGLAGDDILRGIELGGLVLVHVVIANATAGTVQLQASNSTGSGTVTIKVNSDLVARRTG